MPDSEEIIQTLMNDVQAALEQNQMQRAQAGVLAALSADPHNTEALKLLAGLKFIEGDDALAFATYKDAIDADGPADSELLHGLASVMLRLGQPDQAAPVLEQALAIDPKYVPALYDLGLIYAQRRESAAAVKAFMAVSHLEPTHKGALLNCAAAFVRQGRFKQAVQWYSQVLNFYPRNATAWSSLGLVYRMLDMPEEAAGCHEKALQFSPNSVTVHWNRANLLLSEGHYAEGFKEYEWRFKRRKALDPRRIDLPRWAGQSLDGERVLLTAEQGLGDMIQFSRFAYGVQARGGHPILELHPALVPLFAAQPGLDVHVLGEPLPKADLTVPLMSLPLALGVELADIDTYPPQLRITADKPETFPREPQVVGFVWRGNKAHEYDDLRSFDLPTMLGFFKDTSAALVSLQTDATEEEQALLAERGIPDVGRGLSSFYDTARWMNPMTMVVSVDTAALHLAASLGVPSLLVLNRFRDWRWLSKRSDSPWYPSLTIVHRGKRQLDVFEQLVQTTLTAMLDGTGVTKD